MGSAAAPVVNAIGGDVQGPNSEMSCRPIRKLLEDAQGAPDAFPGIGRKAVREDHAVEILDRGDTEPDLGQRLELVERDRLARAGALQALHCVLVSVRDSIEHRDDITCFGIGFLDRDGEQ